MERIVPAGGASPRGHYSPALRAGDFVYVSGQGPIDPVTDKLAAGDVEFQTRLTLSNIRRILEAAGVEITDVVKCSVFLRDIADFAEDEPRLCGVFRGSQTGTDDHRGEISPGGNAGGDRLRGV